MPRQGETMKATIYDVAERARVSIATVSRVLSGRARVTEETRARVMEAVAALNYRPSPVAQGLAMRATRVLAFFYESFQSRYASLLLSGAESEAAANGYALIAVQIRGRQWDDLLRMTGRADGVIVPGVSDQEQFLQALHQAATPTVLLGHARPDLLMDGVVADNRAGIAAAVEHLVQHGRQRLAHIAGPGASGDSAERQAAFKKAVAAAGLPVRKEWIQPGDMSVGGGTRAMEALLALPERPDAVVAANDLQAIGAMQALARHGLDVPGDVAIIGFDGLEEGEYVTPPLTSVYQPISAIGRAAVRLLLARLGDPEAQVCEEVLPVELIVRGSCGEHDSSE